MVEIIEGKQGRFVVVYHRYGGHYDDDFETLEEALHFIEAQEDRGEIWAEKVLRDGVQIHRDRRRSDPFPAIE